MKIYELKIGDIIQQKTKNETILLQFRGCDGQYGKFVEVNTNDKPIINNEIKSEEKNMIYFACFVELEDLNMILYKKSKKVLNEYIKSFKNILFSWFK